jgi:hypothetical protein
VSNARLNRPRNLPFATTGRVKHDTTRSNPTLPPLKRIPARKPTETNFKTTHAKRTAIPKHSPCTTIHNPEKFTAPLPNQSPSNPDP